MVSLHAGVNDANWKYEKLEIWAPPRSMPWNLAHLRKLQESVPQKQKGVVFVSDINDEQIAQAAGRPKLTSTFQAVLELTTDGFHRAGSNRGVAGGQVGIVEVVAVILEIVILEIVDLAADERIGGIVGQDFQGC